MNITVVGVGHVGLVSAACFAHLGHDVLGMDDNPKTVASLRDGRVPFHEPGLQDLVTEGMAPGRLRFTDDAAEAFHHAEIAFVCVGTPSLPNGAPNLVYVEGVGRSAALHAVNDLVLVEKSTVPASTGGRLLQAIRREQAIAGTKANIDVASNPEFLREGTAVHDTLHPDRIVIGAATLETAHKVRAAYEPLLERHSCPVLETDLATAELIKHASNAFLATKISFINAVARVCELVGADVEQVADGMGFDARIGRQFLNAGLGYGGSCLLPDETVLARRAGAVRHLTIASFLSLVASEGLDAWEVLSWHPERRRPEFLPVSAATARPYRGDIVEVRTKLGRRVRTTADHPFLVGDGTTGTTTVRLADQLTTSDWLPLASARERTSEAEQWHGEVLAAVGVVGSTNGTAVASRLELDADFWRIVGLSAERVPDAIWEAPVEHQRALLRGLWDGDGSWSLVNGGPSVVLEYGTVSRTLADGMLRLLGDLGLFASVRIGRTEKSTVDTYSIRLSGADQIEAALWLLPEDEAESIRASMARQFKRIAPTGYRAHADGSAWVRVTGTKRARYAGAVYSLEVPDAHTIVTTGGLVTHNCFPKDVDAFLYLSRSAGYEFPMLEEVRRINQEQRAHVLERLRTELWHIDGKTVTLLGAAFKPGTDDLREAPAMYIARQLLEEGARVRVYDPVALPRVKEHLPEAETVDDAITALRGAHAVVVCTEWPEVAALTPSDFVEALGYPIVIDGRNVYDPAAMVAAGVRYFPIGRPVAN